ncbi:hypothetical protein [Insolitispirillum peregrinum]|uniref:Uncharacterized protein n=1 Tax=Insolitispirillum peregrinum TaxID=80876 RepID=A0A1N7JLI9_9PROT|nr:hypothetical protein [Insolitispirillum peregrinum]SIS50165.1 hypothetical protein SAMN05421779_102369 [Insolitispirillum peregrinum]
MSIDHHTPASRLSLRHRGERPPRRPQRRPLAHQQHRPTPFLSETIRIAVIAELHRLRWSPTLPSDAVEIGR